MNIVAIVPFTGSEKLVAMAEDCIEQLLSCTLPQDTVLRVIAVNNKASRQIKTMLGECPAVDELGIDTNVGFGEGVNQAIRYAIHSERMAVDHFLIVNSDLKFPDRNWLIELLREVEGRYVLSPRTDITATVEACHPGPADIHAQRVREVSAFCWLVPRQVTAAISVRWPFELFPPQFTNYGSDDAAAAILRSLYGGTPFKIVHRSWVKHLKAQTANELGVKAGTKELLTDLKKWKSANRLK